MLLNEEQFLKPPPPSEKLSLIFFSVLINRPICINTGNICIYMYVLLYTFKYPSTYEEFTKMSFPGLSHFHRIYELLLPIVYHIVHNRKP